MRAGVVAHTGLGECGKAVELVVGFCNGSVSCCVSSEYVIKMHVSCLFRKVKWM